jgi:hypothetical protein
MPWKGPTHEWVTVIRASHPLAFIVREYDANAGHFDQERLEQALGSRLNTQSGANRLAMAGFAIVRLDGTQVELRPADPRVARFVNRARLRPQHGGGYKVHRVIEAMLYLPPKANRRRKVTVDRRLKAYYILKEKWLINCDDLLDPRSTVRLVSCWSFPVD